jgi:RND family efflux transporter MFP subunit
MKSLRISWLKKFGPPIALVGLSIIIAMLFVIFKPKVKKEDHDEVLPIVEVIELKKETGHVMIKAQGYIEPTHILHILSEVNGTVIFTHEQFVDGGIIKKGDILVKIDPEDYELIIAQKRSTLANAKLHLSIETAEQEVALEEFQRRNEKDELTDNAKDLATRNEFLQKVKSEYTAALAELKRAEITRQKTVIRAPIDGMISKTSIHKGEFINAHQNIAIIYGIDEFKAEVNISLQDLPYLSFSHEQKGPGSKAIISQISAHDAIITREGIVSRLLPDLGSLGHMARVIITIKDPLLIKDNQLPLLAKAKVNVSIEGNDLKDIFIIPRAALTEDDMVLAVDESSKIVPLKLQIIRKERDVIYAQGQELSNAKIIVTKTSALVGQQVKLARQHYDN